MLLRDLQGSGALGAGLVHGVGLLALVFGRSVQQPGNGSADQLDMANLFGAYALEQVLIRFGCGISAEIDALEQILHHGAHLAELPAQPFLKRICRRRIGFVDGNFVYQ